MFIKLAVGKSSSLFNKYKNRLIFILCAKVIIIKVNYQNVILIARVKIGSYIVLSEFS